MPYDLFRGRSTLTHPAMQDAFLGLLMDGVRASFFFVIATVSTVPMSSLAADGSVRQAQALLSEATELNDKYRGDSAIYDAADQKLRQAIDLDPNNSEIYIQLGRHYLNGGKWSLADESLSKALKVDPNNGNAYVMLAALALDEKRYEEAFRDLDKADRLHADPQRVAIMRARTLAADPSKQDLAIAEFESVLRMPGLTENLHLQALDQLSLLYPRHGALDKANSAFLAELKLDPESPWVMSNYSGFLRMYRLDEAGAEQWARRALAKMDFAVARRNLGLALYLKWARVLIDEGDPVRAQAIFDEAQANYSDLAELVGEIPGYPKPHPIIAALKSKGVSINSIEGFAGSDTPLILATRMGKISILEALLANGANVNTPGYQEWTPLMCAAASGNLSAVKALLNHGANPQLVNSEGVDAEALARKEGHDAAASLIASAKKTAGPLPPSDPVRPFVVGAAYRTIKDVPQIGGYGDSIAAGRTLIFVDVLQYTDPEIVGFRFYDATSKGDVEWPVRAKDIGSWGTYFEAAAAK